MTPMQRCFRDLVCQLFVTTYAIDAYLCLAMLHAWTLKYQHNDTLRLTVDPYEGRKPSTSWRRPPDCPSNVWLNRVQEDASALSYLRCGDLRSPGVVDRRTLCRSAHNTSTVLDLVTEVQ